MSNSKPAVSDGDGLDRDIWNDSFEDLYKTADHSSAISFKHFSQVSFQAQPGDLVEIQRGFYSHYALYLGNGKVMNVDAEFNTVSEARIREHSLEYVCNGSQARVINHDQVAQTHFHVSPRAAEHIICAAKSFENQLVPYQFDFRNCEYYCTFWRYGIGFSTQAAKPTLTPIVGQVASDSLYTAQVYNNTVRFLDGDGFSKYKQLVNIPSTIITTENADAQY